MALVHGLHRLRDRADLGLFVAHVHHGLRGAAADADEACVGERAADLGLPFVQARVDPGRLREGGPKRARPTIQEAARRLRWQALEALCDRVEADCIATAHHLDDQVETVLMRLLRGTSPDGLGGMSPISADGRRVRPLLACSRAEIEAWARHGGLRWREDESNASDAYTRNRLRRRWIPGLSADFNPQLLRAVGRLAEAQRRDSAWIADLVGEVELDWVGLDRGAGSETRLLRLEGWRDLPEALARRLMARAVTAVGGGRDLSATHIERAVDFVSWPERHEGGRTIELPGGLRLARVAKHFRLSRAPGEDGP
jgi:tRNA(Ile)-lysidine synthase